MSRAGGGGCGLVVWSGWVVVRLWGCGWVAAWRGGGGAGGGAIQQQAGDLLVRRVAAEEFLRNEHGAAPLALLGSVAQFVEEPLQIFTLKGFALGGEFHAENFHIRVARVAAFETLDGFVRL